MRWWDGSAWTEKVQGANAAGSVAVAAPPSQAPPQMHGNPKADAKAAKAYAKASRKWYMKKRWWLAAAIIVMILASVASGGGGSDTEPATDDSSSQSSDAGTNDEAPDEQVAPTKPKVKLVKVQAAAMLKEFEENEATADGKYKGKTLQVTGVLDKVDTEFFDDSEYVARIGAGTDFEIITVNCNDQSSKDVAAIKKGQDITVVGKFDDGGDLGVELKDCTIK